MTVDRSQPETLVLVDGSSLAFRSFYAMFKSGLRAKDGTPTGAVHGFFASLFDLIERQKPDMLAVCFDLADPTFRHQEFEAYKANRDEMPDELAVQWPIIKEGVEIFEIPLYELSGYEADDVIGTVAKQAAKEGKRVLILTGDQDAFQLLEEEKEGVGEGTIEVLMPSKGELLTYKRQQVFDKLGVWPEQIIDYKGLCGDKSDNIPGVRGIGEVTAAKLLSAYGTMEGIYEHLDEIKSKSWKEKLTEGRQSAFDSKRLATIVLDVPLTFDFHQCKLSVPDLGRVTEYFQRLNFKQLTTRVPKILARFGDIVMPEATAAAVSPSAPGNTIENALTTTGSAPAASTPAGDPVPMGVGGQLKLDFSTSTSVAVLNRPQVNIAPMQEPTLITTEAEFEKLLAELKEQSVITVDLETTGLKSTDTEIVGWALAWDKAVTRSDKGRLAVDKEKSKIKSAYIPVRHQITGERGQLAPDYVAAKLKPLMEDANTGKIAQNAKFEMNVMSLVGITLAPIIFDPMLASYIENPDNKHGLKEQSTRILNYQMVKIGELIGSGRKQITIDMVPLDQVAAYAADDARITLELAKYYAGILDDEQLYLLYEMELPLSTVLAKMEQNGMDLDLPYLRDFSVELTTELGRLESEIYQLAGHGFNINSTQQLQNVLFEELGLKTKGKTKTGFSTDASVLESLREEHAIVGKLLDFRHISKLRSTYVDALPREVSPRDKRLHGEFNQTIASTGRLSSSNPNLQNIPIRTEIGRRIRRAFIAPEGSSLISADYSQIELRLLAHMSGDELLIDAFEKDQDIHERTAGEVFEIPIEEVTSDQRRIGKTINFALVYQQGAYSTAQDLGISTKEAQAFIDKYFSRYPKVKGFLNGTIDEAREHGYAKTIWGRKRYFTHLHDRNDNVRKTDERAACNAPIQGSAADLVKLAMIKLHEELKASGLSAKLILQVHDELVLEVKDEEIEAAKALLTGAMTLGQPLAVPLKVDIAVAKNWMEAK